MNEVLRTYKNLLDKESLPIQQQEVSRIDEIIRETGLCIILGYHGSGKSSLARRYSYFRTQLKKVYCKNICPNDILQELRKNDQPIFLDSVTDALYEEELFRRIKDRSKQSPVVLGVHIEPQNTNMLFSELRKNLIIAGPLNHKDAKLLANYPFNQPIENIDRLLEYSGKRRRDLINLCSESYSVREDFSSKSIEEGTLNLADKIQRVYRHIFEKHLTKKQRDLLKKILTKNSTSQQNDESEILIRTGLITKIDNKLALNGKLIKIIIKKILN